MIDEVSNRLQHHTSPISTPSRAVCFMEVDPVCTEERYTTEVLVCREDALNITQMLRGDICFIAMGSTARVNSVGEATQTNNVILAGLLARKKSRWPLVTCRPRCTVASYSPEIAVTASASDDTIEPPFTMPAVYAALPMLSDDTANAYGFHAELRLKFLNRLRFCHSKGHRDLIITGRFTTSAVEVALSFQELLTKSGGEVEGRFQRVIFAIPKNDGNDISDDVSFFAFWEVFHMPTTSMLTF